MVRRNRHRESLRARRDPAADPRTTATAPLRPPEQVRWLSTRTEAQQLAELLLTDLRWPVAVISIPSGATAPYIDAQAIKDEIGDLGEVVVMPTSEVSWEFSDAMPAMTQVYGGAGRVYGIDGAWRQDPYRSPLRFAYSTADSNRVVSALARDVAAFTLGGRPQVAQTLTPSRRRTGRVQALVGDSRALVRLDDGVLVSIWAELTVPDLHIEQIVGPGQELTGQVDGDAKRFDVRGALRRPAQALSHYRVGSTIPARVDAVGPDSVTLTVFPGVEVVVPREHITDNPLDRVSDLFSRGEVVLALVESLDVPAPELVELGLRLDLVDDEGDAAPAPAVLDGGPPWLELAPLPRPDVLGASTSAPADAPVLSPVAPTSDRPPAPGPLVGPRVLGATPAAPPTRPPPPVREPRGPQPQREIAALQAELRGLAGEVHVLQAENAELKTKLREAGARGRKALRTVSRAQGTAQGTGPAWPGGLLFDDPEQQFRFEVTLEWARRIPAGQKREHPLREYAVGPRFLPSLGEVQGVERAKVVAVVVEVVTGLASELDSRELHPLRAADSGGAPAVRRDDGAVCMRLALQRNTPGARRLHYWNAKGSVELSRVVHHDDMSP